MATFNYFKLAWSVAYILLTGSILAGTWWLALYPFNPALAAHSNAFPWIWMAISATAGYWLPLFLRMRQPIRRPILEEELILLQCLQNVRHQLTSTASYQLWFDESPGLNAAAIGRNTIIFSIDLFKQFTPEELEAVMAHEIGHLSSRDTLIGGAYNLSALMAWCAQWLARKTWHYLGRNTRQRIGLLSIAILLVCWQTSWHGIGIIAALLLPLWGFPLLNYVFRIFRMAESRRTEYRQDAFAQSLGYGPALKIDLTKLFQEKPAGNISLHHLLFHGTHPITQHRIRKLEQLDGQRAADGSLHTSAFINP